MTKIYLFIKHILQVIALILIYSCFEQHLTMKLNLVLFLHFFCWDFGIRYCLYFKGDICKYLLVFKHIWFLQMFVFLRFHHQVLFVFERRDLWLTEIYRYFICMEIRYCFILRGENHKCFICLSKCLQMFVFKIPPSGIVCIWKERFMRLPQWRTAVQ